MKQTDPQLKLRLPPNLMEQLKRAIADSRRKISGEIVARLEWTFRNDAAFRADGVLTTFARLPELPEKAERSWIAEAKKHAAEGVDARLEKLEDRIKVLEAEVAELKKRGRR